MRTKLITLFTIVIIFISCKTEPKHGTIPFNKFNNLPIVTLSINDKKVRLLLDTGANSNILDESLENKLKFKTYESDIIFNGIGGQQKSKIVKNIIVKYKDSIIKIKFKASDLTNIRKVIYIDGIIGSEFFNQNNIVIDYKNNKMYRNN